METAFRVGAGQGLVSKLVTTFSGGEFDPHTNSLTVAGKSQPLDRSSGAVLALLLECAGTEVSKGDLLTAGWPDRIVHENSLAKAISRLRRALAASGLQIEAAYGRGYRLVMPVPPETTPDEMPASPPSARGQVSRPLLAAIILLAALVGGAAGYAIFRHSQKAEVAYRAGEPIIGDAPDAIGRVVWADDHPQNNVMEKRLFEHHRIAVHNVLSTSDALKLLAMYHYRLVVSDMGRGDDRLAGLKLVAAMRERGDTTPVIIYTIRADGAAAQRAQRDAVKQAGADLAVTPQQVREMVLARFGNPPARD